MRDAGGVGDEQGLLLTTVSPADFHAAGQVLHSLDSASDYAGPASNQNGELVIRVRNDDISMDQTRPDVGLPYLFPDSTDIDVDADLVVAPGTTARLASVAKPSIPC